MARKVRSEMTVDVYREPPKRLAMPISHGPERRSGGRRFGPGARDNYTVDAMTSLPSFIRLSAVLAFPSALTVAAEGPCRASVASRPAAVGALH